MLKYNDTHNLVTTDDVTLGGNITPKLGKSLTEILETLAKEIEELRSNIKWISKYGGIGGNGSGGDSNSSNKIKTLTTITYVRSDNTGLTESASYDHKREIFTPILVKTNSKVIIRVDIKSQMLTGISYGAVLTYNESSLEALISPVSKSVLFTLPASEVSYACSLKIVGGERDILLEFKIFTKAFEHDIKLIAGSNGQESFNNNASIPPNYRDTLKLNTYIHNLIPELFDIEYTELKINDISLPLPLSLDDSPIPVASIFTNYGLYNLLAKFKVVNKSGVIVNSQELNYWYVYKDIDKSFIYVYSDSAEVSVYNEETVENPSSVNLRNIPLKIKIYGRSEDGPNMSYKLSVRINDGEEITSDKFYVVNKEYSYIIPNTASSTSPTKIKLTFDNYADSAIDYYLWVLKPVSVGYVFLTAQGLKCYGAVGDNTDADTPNNTVIFPTKQPGSEYYQFLSNSGNELKVKELPKTVLQDDNKPLESILEFITCNPSLATTKLFDTVINIGINYLDSSYTTPIFTLEDRDSKSNHKITFYRNSISYDSQSTDRFGMPDDGKFHLITIYLKLLYNLNVNSVGGFGSTAYNFAVFIDGVLDVKPTSVLFNVTANTTCIFTPGTSLYNFFGIEHINPVTTEASKYNELVKKYVCDYDTIFVSNYYMKYANEHKTDLGYILDPFDEQQLNIMSRDIYSSLINDPKNYINYYNINAEKGGNIHDKFIPVLMKLFVQLLNPKSSVPIFRIVPRYSQSTDVEQGLHSFIYNTMTSYGEDDAKAKTKWDCDFQRYDPVTKKWYSVMEPSRDGKHAPTFQVKYQGSSTLLYSAKNFEISSKSYHDKDKNLDYSYYFNPDSSVFRYPELSFNLKADIVDSSSSTNNVIGNFVNDYMVSPFGEDYKACLSGRPIFLFVSNVNQSLKKDDENGDENTSEEELQEKDIDFFDTLFLGIYNLNLNRSSLNNLGYLKFANSLLESKQVHSNSAFNNMYYCITDLNSDIKPTQGMCVAEIQGNGNIYDLTLFDLGLLNKIYDDFYVVDALGDKISNGYSTEIQTFSKDFALYVRNKILHYLNTDVFSRNDYGIEHENGFNNQYDTLISTGYSADRLYYYNGTVLTPIPSDGIIVKALDINAGQYYSYKLLDSNNLSIVGNMEYLFHVVYDKNGSDVTELATQDSTYYYYVEKLSSFTYDSLINPHIFDLTYALKYYMVCMAFSMVDSVLKNLNIKKVNNNPIWYPLFYDMDTALALDNAGANSNYKAFSDYITDAGRIISDYVDPEEKAWFDVPSSYLFLYAKYDALLNHLSKIDGEDDPLKYTTPLEFWLSLRGVPSNSSENKCAGSLENALKFCNDYLYKYLEEDIPPMIWNMNYMYKYFSFSKNKETATNKDTEQSRFNGKMIYRRRTWLELRLHYLDALFGIMNTRTIGYTSVKLAEAVPQPTSNSDIILSTTMFPQLLKGATGKFKNITVVDEPRTPLIFRTDTNQYTLYITNNAGEAVINNEVHGNTDMGFYGTIHLKSISDCAPLLVREGLANHILGDQLLEVKVSRDCEDVSLLINLPELETLTAVKNITIGDQAANIKINREILIQGSEDNKPEISLIIKKVNCPKITIENCILTNISNLTELHPIKDGLMSIIFNNVTFLGNIDIKSSNFTTLQFKACNLKNFTVTSNKASGVSLSMESSTINGPNNSFIADIKGLETLTIQNSAIHNFRHQNSRLLRKCEVEFNGQIEKDTEFCLNYAYAGGNTYWTHSTNASAGNLCLSTIKITRIGTAYSGNPGFKNIILRLPMFNILETLDLTGHFLLGAGGIAGSIIPSITVPAKNSTSGNGIVGLAADASWAFGYTKCTIPSSSWNLLLERTTKATFLMHYRRVNTTIEEICNILNGIKANNQLCNIAGLFALNTITSAGKAITSLSSVDNINITNRIAAVYPERATERGNQVFFRSNLRYLTTALASKLGGVYTSYLGSSANYNYIESGALNTFTSIRSGDNLSYSAFNEWDHKNHYPYLRFYTYTEENGFEDVTHVKYSELFRAAESLCLDVYTFKHASDESLSVMFDFEEGMGPNIKTYTHLFYFISFNNILNIENMFNNTTSLTKVSTDFVNLELIEDRNDPLKVVDLYNFLVDKNSQIKTSAYNLMNVGNTDTLNYTLAGSFTKKISASNFVTLLKILAGQKGDLTTKKSSISNIFHNCYVEGINTTTFWEDAFKGVLGTFTSLASAFRNCKFYNNVGQEIPINLENAFLVANPLKGEELFVPSGTPLYLNQAFENTYLEPFTNTGIGLSNNTITYGNRTFYNCRYNYSLIVNNLPTALTSGPANYIRTFQLPVESEARTLLPENFLNICKNNSTSTESMFANSFYDPYHLTGYLPEIMDENDNRLSTRNYFCGNNIRFRNTFTKCNIYYHKFDNDDYKLIIFSKWYTYYVDGTSKFDVYIPLPLSKVLGDEDMYHCSLFGNAEDILVLGNYGILSSYPQYDTYAGYAGSVYMSAKTGEGINGTLFLTLDTGELPLKGNNFKNILPYTIVCTLGVSLDSTIVTNVKSVGQGNYYPINSSTVPISTSTIYQGVLRGITSCNLLDVTAT